MARSPEVPPKPCLRAKTPTEPGGVSAVIAACVERCALVRPRTRSTMVSCAARAPRTRRACSHTCQPPAASRAAMPARSPYSGRENAGWTAAALAHAGERGSGGTTLQVICGGGRSGARSAVTPWGVHTTRSLPSHSLLSGFLGRVAACAGAKAAGAHDATSSCDVCSQTGSRLGPTSLPGVEAAALLWYMCYLAAWAPAVAHTRRPLQAPPHAPTTHAPLVGRTASAGSQPCFGPLNQVRALTNHQPSAISRVMPTAIGA